MVWTILDDVDFILFILADVTRSTSPNRPSPDVIFSNRFSSLTIKISLIFREQFSQVRMFLQVNPRRTIRQEEPRKQMWRCMAQSVMRCCHKHKLDVWMVAQPFYFMVGWHATSENCNLSI